MLNPNFAIALYIRISNEDEDIGTTKESNSVKNQRDLLNSFLDKHWELSRHKRIEFTDDGHSGTNFYRPAVSAMLDRVKSGDIKCIVVKDFSRFGRNYIEVGSFLEQILPFFGVRFLSVNDNFDSNTRDADSIDVALKSLINDLYSKDLSIKSKDGLNSKKHRGEFAGAVPVYGYKKSAKNKNRLEIDNEPAEIVRIIFKMAAEGKRAKDIAIVLNGRGIPPRSLYKASAYGGKDWKQRDSLIGSFWRACDIREVVAQECYTGAAVANKRERRVIGGKEVAIPREHWTIVHDAHPAIITRTEYEVAQKMLERIPRAKSHIKPWLIKNKVRCSACGYVMQRSRGKNPKYICITPQVLHSAECIVEPVYELMVDEVVLSTIQTYVRLLADAEKLHTEQSVNRDYDVISSKAKAKHTIANLETRISQLTATKQEHYERYKDSEITKGEYFALRDNCNRQIANYTEEMDLLKMQDQPLETMPVSSIVEDDDDIVSLLDEAINSQSLNQCIVDTFIESVIAHGDAQFEVKLKCIDPLQ